ncbi:partial putative peptidyl-prolyl cis-trans isomerase, partial [uncultured bacterium]
MAKQYAAAPAMVIDPKKKYTATFKTEAGDFVIELFADKAPKTVNNFVFLARDGFYDGVTFHRVIRGFMAQGGDPTATGTGGPGYQFADEFVGFLHFDRPGWLAMANAGAGTNGSQFFITTTATPHLNNAHTIFGEVLEGQENVDALRLRDPNVDTEPGAALETVVIVTDPSTVTTTYEAPAPATEEDFQAVLDFIAEQVGAPLAANEDATGIFTADEVVAAAPEALREDYAALLDEHHFEYRVGSSIVSAECDLEASPITAIGYALDVFASREDAAAVLADGLLQQIPIENGMSQLDDSAAASYPVFTETATTCDTEVLRTLTHWQRGRYVVTTEVTYASSVPASPDAVLPQFVDPA